VKFKTDLIGACEVKVKIPSSLSVEEEQEKPDWNLFQMIDLKESSQKK